MKFITITIFVFSLATSAKSMPGGCSSINTIDCSYSSVADTIASSLKIHDTTKVYVPLSCNSASGTVPSCYTVYMDVWLTFTTVSNGTIEWTAMPDPGGRWYDWTLWDISSGLPGTEVLCFNSPSGMCDSSFGMGSTPYWEVGAIAANAGETYAIQINNVAQSGVGFEFSWNGTADISSGTLTGFTLSATEPTSCGSEDGVILIEGLLSDTTYHVWYDESGELRGPFSLLSDAIGKITLTNLGRPTYDRITVALENYYTFTHDTIIHFNNNIVPIFSGGTPDKSICLGDSAYIVKVSPDSAIITWDNGITNGEYISPPTLGVHSYVATADLNGCLGTDTVEITVVEKPEISGGPDQWVCNGELVTLSGSGAANYYWIPQDEASDGVPFLPPQNTTTSYIVGGYEVWGCWGDTALVNVTSSPVPEITVGIVTHDDGSYSGAINISVSSGTPPFVINWSGPNSFSSSNEDISGLVAGDYVVTIVDSNGCSGTLDTITVLSTLGIAPNFEEDEIIIYPNPTTDHVMIVVKSGESLQYRLENIYGQTIISNAWFTKAAEIDIGHVESGVYLLVIANESGYKMVRRLVKM